jgi:hypothetical protein
VTVRNSCSVTFKSVARVAGRSGESVLLRLEGVSSRLRNFDRKMVVVRVEQL